MAADRCIRILLHHPGDSGWREIYNRISGEIASNSITLDKPTSLVAICLRSSVSIERGRQIGDLFRQVVQNPGSVEVDLSNVGCAE
jgi:hypothetical protein